MLETMQYEYQRNPSQQWVDYLAEEMRRGSFKQNTTIDIAVLNGRPCITDGQHRLWAVVQSGLPQTFVVCEVQARSADHVAWMYGTTDIGRTRPRAALWNGLQLVDELGLTTTQLSGVGAAVNFMRGGLITNPEKMPRPHPDDQIEAMRLYAPHAIRFFELVKGGQYELRKAWLRAATCAVALLTIRYIRDAELVERFWSVVATDDGLKATDPRKYANRHLTTSTMLTGRRSGVMAVTAARSVRILVSCFNAYATGREMAQTPRVPDETSPIVITGVPRDPAKWLV